MDNQHAEDLTLAINGLTSVLEPLVSADATTTVFTAGMAAWVLGWSVGLVLKMLSKIS